MPTPESDRAARRRLVWLLLTRGDVGAEALRTDGLPALRSAPTRPHYDAGGSARNASASSKRASASSRRSPNSSRNWATR